MSSNKTLQSGARPSQAIKDTTKRRTGLLQDNSWIKREIEEDEPVDVDPNYGKGILLKTQNNGSKPAEAALTNTGSASLTKSTTTSKSSVTTAKSTATTTSNKPPVPAKNSAFTARVFSGANSSEKPLTPVKRPVDVKSPVSKEPPKDATNGNNSVPLSPSPIAVTPPLTKSDVKPATPPSTTTASTSVRSSSQTITTFTSPEKTQSYTVTKTEQSSKSYEQSNGNTAPKSTTAITSTITTTSNPATSTVKSPSKTLDALSDTLSPTLSPTVHTNPVSVRSSSQTITTFTSPEKTQSYTVTKTEQSSKSYEQSPKSQLDSLSYTLSQPVNTASTKSQLDSLSYTSSQPVNTASTKSQLDSLSYTSSQPVNTASTTLRTSVKQSETTSQTLHSPLNSPPTQLSTRIVGKRDLCSFCGKSISGGERMILDDLKIFSHTTCFKCELCYRSLGNLEAGATLWVHREKVNCENCYKKTKDQWFH